MTNQYDDNEIDIKLVIVDEEGIKMSTTSQSNNVSYNRRPHIGI